MGRANRARSVHYIRGAGDCRGKRCSALDDRADLMLDEPISHSTPNRLPAVTEKIGREITGLAGALYVHVTFQGDRPHSVNFSHRQRDESTIDKILTALGDTVTDIIRKGQPYGKTDFRQHGIGAAPAPEPTHPGVIDEIIADVREANMAARLRHELCHAAK